MKVCFDCVNEVIYTDNFGFAKVPVKDNEIALVLKSDIGEHILGVYSSEREFNRALSDVQHKAEDVLSGMYGNKVVHIFAKESYKERVVFQKVDLSEIIL